MLLAALSAIMLQVGPEPLYPAAPTWEAAHPALMAKAPGAPGYGVQFTTRSGKLVFTNLHFDPATRAATAQLYRIQGPVGLGPYRLGLELGFHPKEAVAGSSHPCWFDNFYYIVRSLDGYPAKAAGLEPDQYGGRWARVAIEGVDGSNFAWDTDALVWHITNSPEIVVNTIKRPIIGGPSRKNIRVTLRKVEAPPDPADGTFAPGGVDPASIKPWLEASQLWKDLLVLRSRLPRTAPLPMELPIGRRWFLIAPVDPGEPNSGRSKRCLEVWKEDPLTAPYPYEKALADLWPEPSDGFQAGRALRIEGQWYRFQGFTQDQNTGRLTAMSLHAWAADIPVLFSGGRASAELGLGVVPTLQESIEQMANEALVEWKTRTLPDLLSNQGRGPTEELVIRLEKGLLTLDLEVKGIRSRLDASARAEAERKAQAELAAKGGQPAPQAQATPATESERLADLLDQRKAILMAILSNAKQALSSLRR